MDVFSSMLIFSAQNAFLINSAFCAKTGCQNWLKCRIFARKAKKGL
jgi:hypothetical protein